jgi:nucleotide-binding universal stress UspA family protein
MTYAAYIARDMDLTVRYLYIFPPAVISLGMPGSLDAAADVSQRDFDREVEKARHHFKLQINNIYTSDPDLPLLEFDIKTGYPTEVIGEYCRSRCVHTIMLSSSKEGSVFQADSPNVEIIRAVRCPVWIVPEGITYKPFSEILYATDYHKEDVPNMKQLAGFASRFPASITAVHVAGDAGFSEKVRGEGFINMVKKETGYELISIKVLPETKGEPLVDELHNFALMIDADLIVFLRENRRFADRLIHGSRSEKIARETQLPVLIYNEERK